MSLRMNERFRLNNELVQDWLDKEARKLRYLANKLNVSDSLVGLMLTGYCPKEKTVKALADLMGVGMDKILIPRKPAKKAS